MQLDLTRPELEEFKLLVETRVGDLSSEIRHAMVHDYQTTLKERKVLLERLSLKLAQALGDPVR
jgi:hypothetical protein